ncbi:MAG: hypothetical protein AAFX57_09435 [Bacteroidota bacterium]
MKKILPVSLIVIFSACQHRLVPTWFSARHNESPVSEITENEVIVRLENLELNMGYMVFDLEVVNNADFPLQFDHGEIMSYSGLKKFEDANEPSLWIKKEVLQIESALSFKEVNDLYKSKLRKGKTIGVLMAVAAIGLIAYDIAADANDYSSLEWTARDARRSATRDAVTAGALLALDVAGNINEVSASQTAEDLAYLPDEIFDADIIPKGDSFRGKVYLNNELINKYYRITIPIEGTSYVFDFKKANSRERQQLDRH